MWCYEEKTLRSFWRLDEVSQGSVDFKEKKQPVALFLSRLLAAPQKMDGNMRMRV
jgi:hypothetical protein